MSGYTMTQAEVLYSMPAPVTKNTFTSNAVISAPATTSPVAKIPGGYFQENPNPIGRCLYLQAFGSLGNVSAATFSPGICLNTTAGTISTPAAMPFYSATATTSGITVQWQCQVWFTCTAFGETAGMTLQVNGQWSQSTVAGGTGAGNASGISGQFASTVTGLTPATPYYVEMCAAWGTSSASNTTTIQQMFLFGLN